MSGRPDFAEKPGFGTLFEGDGKNPRAPLFSGNICTPDGASYRVSIWEKDKRSRTGARMYQVKIQSPDDVPQRTYQADPAPPSYRDRDTYQPPGSRRVMVQHPNGAIGPMDEIDAVTGGYKILGPAA